MYFLIESLLFLPFLVSALILILPRSISNSLVVAASIILSSLSVIIFIKTGGAIYFGLPHYVNDIVVIADLLLLLYFGWTAIKKRSWLVGLMSVLQFGGLLYLVKVMPASVSDQFMVDKLSAFMFLLINVISGIIAIYSLRYIEEENCSRFRKKYFISAIFWFIAVMNLLVSSDNLEYFFLFFELTTLASFLFIGFRKDEISGKNSLDALWMNQVGGVAILAAVFFIEYYGYGEATFTNLLAHAAAPQMLLPLSLFCIAALIKGAQLPFSKWLLGAMVAPTPVSALLHSSTMVKIAPFIILRLSPALKGTPVANVVIILSAFVFVVSGIAALSQYNFKKILAHSTISLLALMILLAAVGTPVTLVASLSLVLFHGISKSMLFLNAGVLEKVFHFKETSDMDNLGETGPFTSFVITMGFMSLLLPPFGAFIAKWFSIETMATVAVHQKLLGAFVILAIAGGGAVLALLYFKVMGVLIARTGNRDTLIFEGINSFYKYTVYLLLGLIICGVLSYPLLLADLFVPVASQIAGLPVVFYTEGLNMHIGSMALPILPLLVAFLVLPVTIIASVFVRFKNADRVKEYMCGEKIEYSFSSLYFSTEKAVPWFSAIGLLLFIVLILVAVF